MYGFKYETSEEKDQWLEELPDPKSQWVYNIIDVVMRTLKNWVSMTKKYFFITRSKEIN